MRGYACQILQNAFLSLLDPIFVHQLFCILNAGIRKINIFAVGWMFFLPDHIFVIQIIQNIKIMTLPGTSRCGAYHFIGITPWYSL